MKLQVILSSLVYEKQQKLRAMMKMHGLGDIAYWTISYCYFLLISLIYMLLLVTFGSVVGNMIPFRLVWKSSIKFALLLPKLMVAQIPKKVNWFKCAFISLVNNICFVSEYLSKHISWSFCNCSFSLGWNYFTSEINLLVFLFPGIKLFASNSYVLQFIIYFTYMNLQISSAFLMTSYFTTVTTATGMLLLELLYFFFVQMVVTKYLLSLHGTAWCSDRISLHNWIWLCRRIFVQAFCWRYLCLKSVLNLLWLLTFRNFLIIILSIYPVLQEARLRWWSSSRHFLCTA